MMKQNTLFPILLTSLALGGCDTFRNTFGLDHYSPNEWDAIEPSPGLILPPDFKHRPKLPPPAPGVPNPHTVSETEKAQKTVLGEAPTETVSSTAKGEQDIVQKASENQPVTPDIRKIVDEEAQEDETVGGKVTNKLKSWKKEASENLGLSEPEKSSEEDHKEDTPEEKD